MAFYGRSYAELVERCAAACIRKTKLTLAIVAVLAALAGLGASRVQVDPSPEAYLLDTPEWQFYAKINREYEIGETIIIAFRELGGTVFDVETVTAIAELDRILSGMPTVERVLSVASASQLARVDGEGLDLTPLLGPTITKDSTLELGQRIRRHPVYSQLLVDRQHESAFLFVQLSSRDDDPIARLKTVRGIRAEVERFRTKHRTVHMAGTAVTKEAIAAGIQHDTLLFFPAALLLLAVLLWFIFGDLIASLVPLGLVALSSLIVMGLFGVLKLPINMATATVPTMILVVGIADSVHFLAEYRRHYARIGERETAILATVSAMALPCLLTAATATIGFGALAISRVGPLRDFGWATAVGLVANYLASVLLMPLFLLLFRYPKSRSVLFPAAPRLGAWTSRFSVWCHDHLFATLAVVGLFVGICVAAVNRIDIDSDFIGYLDQDHRLRADIEMIERTLGGTDVVEVILDSTEAGYFKQGSGLRVLDKVCAELSKLKGVSRCFSLADYMRLANAVMTGIPAGQQAPLPETAEAVAQLALLDPLAFSALTSEEMTETRLTLQIRTLSTEEILQLTGRAQEVTNTVLADVPVKATFTGLPPLFAKIVRNLVEDASKSFGLATVVIFLAMLIGLRSLAMAIAAMIPNVLTVAVTFATMAVLGMSFDTNSAFVACLGLGIAIDDTIHITSRYLRAREEGSPTPGSAVQYAITHSGHPVVLTSVLFMVGFSVLMLSSFQPTFRVGLLSVILVAHALLLDLFLLPVLLMLADRLEQRFGRPPDAQEARRFRRQINSLITSAQAPEGTGDQSKPSKGSSAKDKLPDPIK